MQPPSKGEDWVALTTETLPVGEIADWTVRPDCGAVVLFSGTARDHSEGRAGVNRLEYEAYEEQAAPRMQSIADALRARWPAVGRVAIVHRVGVVPIGESSVVVAVSSPHRADAFDAGRFAIDTVKETVPIWKRETWAGGESWGLDAAPVVDVGVPDRGTAAL